MSKESLFQVELDVVLSSGCDSITILWRSVEAIARVKETKRARIVVTSGGPICTKVPYEQLKLQWDAWLASDDA